jgi:RNA:NAD 2'-phosphotransferase (TPT1/KptA family)
MSNPPKHPSRGGKPLRGHPKDSPQVRLSKTLSWILRHGAKSEGLYMRPDGYVRVSDLVRVILRRPGHVYGNLLRHGIVIASFTQIVFAYPARPCRPAKHSRE